MCTRDVFCRVMTTMLFWEVGAAISPASGQSLNSTIWDGPIMAQPFDSRPFRAVRIPGWVQETTGCGYTLSVMDSKGRAAAAAHGVTISEMGFVDPFYRLLRQQAAQEAQPARPARPAGQGHRRIQAARRSHPWRLSSLPPGRGLREPPRLAADRHQYDRDPSDRHEEVSAWRDALPARALRRLLHRRPRRDPDQVSRRRRLQLRRSALRRGLLLRALPRRTTARTPAAEIPQHRHERPGLPPLSALGRSPDGRPDPCGCRRGSRGSSRTWPWSPGRPTPAGSATS